MEFESYRHVCNKWQHKLLKASITCLESEDYVQLRNILVILPRLMPNFPKVSNHAEQMQAAIEKLSKQEQNKRQDIRAKSMGYLSLLRMHKPNLIPVEKFHIVKKPVTKAVTKTEAKPAEATIKSEKKEREESSSRQHSKSIREAQRERNREGSKETSRNRSEKRETSARPDEPQKKKQRRYDDEDSELAELKETVAKDLRRKERERARRDEERRDEAREDLRNSLKYKDDRREPSKEHRRRR